MNWPSKLVYPLPSPNSFITLAHTQAHVELTKTKNVRVYEYVEYIH